MLASTHASRCWAREALPIRPRLSARSSSRTSNQMLGSGHKVWLPFFAAVGCWPAKQVHDRRASRATPSLVRLRASRDGEAELLVDGYTRQVSICRQAIQLLQQEGRKVFTTVFAEPEIQNDKLWSDFMQSAYNCLCPVERTAEGRDAVTEKLSHLAATADGACLALLATDTRYVELVKNIVATRRDIVVCVPRGAVSSVHAYQETGARVLPLGKIQEGPKIRAFLDPDGSGRVETAGPWKAARREDQAADELTSFLQEWGYRGERGYLIPSVAKFWFAHDLGRLTVFPAQAGCAAAHQKILYASPGTAWIEYRNDLAFFLPVGDRQAPSRVNAQLGGQLAGAIYRGGGPFIIEDSEDMVREVLHRMGYLDEEFSNDLSEALLTFVSMPENSYWLRKNCKAMPDPTDTAEDVVEKLRRAFLSHDTSGQWRRAPDMRPELLRAGFLRKQHGDQSAVADAMRRYIERYGLEERRSCIGNAYTVLRHFYRSESDPRRRIESVTFRM
ncbi:unnamed protein product [Symbiodinium sp. CCMP2592]|nr:unnamed protein product [Symbiodinium sp. CCMP2592]